VPVMLMEIVRSYKKSKMISPKIQQCVNKHMLRICVISGVSKISVNGTRKQTKQKIQTNQLYWPSK
jgi:hypothetical protein